MSSITQAHSMTPLQGAGAGQALEVCLHMRDNLIHILIASYIGCFRAGAASSTSVHYARKCGSRYGHLLPGSYGWREDRRG